MSIFMRSIRHLVGASVFLLGTSAFSQTATLSYESQPEPLKLPKDVYLGEVAGVATNSKGHIFVLSRSGSQVMTMGANRAFLHGGAHLYEFDGQGTYVREMAQDLYALLTPHSVRVDRADNIWVVDEQSNMVIKFSPTGQVLMTLGRKPESVGVPVPAAANGDGLGIPGDNFKGPTDIAWDAAGNIFVADGTGNARIVKLDPKGFYIKSWGGRGSGDGQMDKIHSLAVDAGGNVYVGEEGNKRIDVFDNSGNFLRSIKSIGTPAAICISGDAHPYLYTSNSNSPIDFDNGEIYKLELSGSIVGKFGKAGKKLKEFGAVHEIDCRTANQLFVAEVANWRIQKLSLK